MAFATTSRTRQLSKLLHLNIQLLQRRSFARKDPPSVKYERFLEHRRKGLSNQWKWQQNYQLNKPSYKNNWIPKTTQTKSQSKQSKFTNYNRNRNNYNNQSNHSTFISKDGKTYLSKIYYARLPYTSDEASKLLMNWNFVKGDRFLESLRESFVRFGKLTDKQMEALRNILMSRRSNKNISPYVTFIQIDPIIQRLLELDENDFNKIKKTHAEFSEILASMQDRLTSKATLTHRELRFTGNMFVQIYGSEKFNPNSRYNKQN